MRLLLLLLLLPCFSQAQQLPSIAEKTKDFTKYPGFFPFYWDEAGGKIWLEIDKLDSEFIYQVSLPGGLGSNDIGLDRGLLGNTRIVKFTKTGRKVFLIQPNYKYRAVTANVAEKRDVAQSFAQSILWGFVAEAATDNRLLVDATDFLLSDAMQVATTIKKQQQGTYTLDKTRSAIYLAHTKNFPLNTELEATETFISNSNDAGAYTQSVTPSPEAVTLQQHHSFVQLPGPGYEPRVFDARSGFIPISFFDYATPVAEPLEKFYIIRHRLQKKDPTAAVSEPLKRITYYLDNGTPEPIRSALLEGASWWNTAFEAAGYKNAFEVKILPDSADPMDIRYNMINWVHRATRGWSYGAAVVDPRTGEIIKGQVTLGSLRVRQDYLIAQGLLAPFDSATRSNDPMLQMALARLKQLAAHEVGHTLGLMHNYAASASSGNSVMDYPHPVVKLDAYEKIDLSHAYDNQIGAWDKVAITWGYGDFSAGTNDSARLDAILTNAIQKGYQFISDRDARAPGGLHPQAHLWDNGKNAVEELKAVMKVRQKALAQFGEKNLRPGTPMALLEDVLVPVYFFHRYQLEAVTKLVGGMYYTYALRGDGQVVTKPLSRQEQLAALQAVLQALHPESLKLPGTILALIPPRPAGYDFTNELFKKRTGLAFDALAPAETLADYTFSFLLHPERLNRMVEYEVENDGLGINELLQTLLKATWKAPRAKGINGLIQLQTEQVLLTYLLAMSVDSRLSYPAKGAMMQALDTIKTFATTQLKASTNDTYKGHLLLTLERLKKPEAAKTIEHPAMPPGAPIGSLEEVAY